MAKRGPKEVELDWTRLDQYLELGARCLDCSEFLGVSEDKIQKDIRKKHNMTFSEYREKKLSKMRMKLLQKQFDVAMQGNVSMLIWLGKNLLNQSDKIETENINTEVQRLVIHRTTKEE